jgi:hypothetical protein
MRLAPFCVAVMIKSMRVFILALPLILLACAKEQTPAPPPQPASAPVTAAPKPAPSPVSLSDNWQDAPRSAGDWVYRRDSRGSVALFGPSGADASFIIRCESTARRIYLSRAGAFPGADTGMMTIRASSGLKSFTVKNNGDTPAYVAVALPVNEPQLDAIAFSRGRFLVSVKGAADLVIPSWPEIARVIEDCRA